MLVAGQQLRLLLLLLLLAEDLAVIRILFYEEDEGGEGEGETAGAEEGYEVSGRGECRPGERFGLTIVDESKSGRVGRLASRLL